MRFACERCKTAYMIADDKVGDGGVLVRCKKCGHENRVRRASDPDSTAIMANPLSPLADAPPEVPAFDELGDELDGAFDNVMAGPKPDTDHAETKVVAIEEIRRLAQQKDGDDDPTLQSPRPNGGVAPAAVPTDPLEWYVGIDDEQVGPLRLSDIAAMAEKGKVLQDTLVWKTGMGDWLPAGEVAEVAPRLPAMMPPPEEPATSAPVATAGERAVAAALEELSREAPLAPVTALRSVPSPLEEDEPTFRPSAASALATLAREEIESLDKPAPPPPPPVRSQPRPSPMAEHAESPRAPETAATVAARMPEPEPAPRQPAPPSAQGPTAGRMMGLVAVTAISVAVLMGGSFALYIWKIAPQAEPAPAPVAVAAPEPVAAPAPPPVPAPVAAPAPVAPAAPVAVTPPPAVEPPAPPPPPPPAPEPPKKEVAKKAPERKRVASAPPPKKRAASKSSDEDDDLLGAAGDSTAFDSGDKAASKRRADVYVPPAPGAANLPQSLGTSDIYAVVRGDMGSIKSCIDGYKTQNAGATGTVVMGWLIRPTGGTSDVKVLTGQYSGTSLANCLTALIKGWKFPKYGGPQMDQIQFPFKF